MSIEDIAILELGLEKAAEELANPDDEEPDVLSDITSGRPMTLADDRQREIRKYEQQQQAQSKEMTNEERLASMGITVMQGES